MHGCHCPGYMAGCANAWGTCQAVGWSMCAPCFKFFSSPGIHLAPYTYPVVMVTVGVPRTYKPFPFIWLCFQILLGCRKISTLFTQRCYSPNVSFVGLFFFLLTLFPTKLSRHTLLILIHGQTTLKICVSLPWLRNHPRALWLAAWFCLWLHR